MRPIGPTTDTYYKIVAGPENLILVSSLATQILIGSPE
jgi:hypothetical protein